MTPAEVIKEIEHIKVIMNNMGLHIGKSYYSIPELDLFDSIIKHHQARGQAQLLKRFAEHIIDESASNINEDALLITFHRVYAKLGSVYKVITQNIYDYGPNTVVGKSMDNFISEVIGKNHYTDYDMDIYFSPKFVYLEGKGDDQRQKHINLYAHWLRFADDARYMGIDTRIMRMVVRLHDYCEDGDANDSALHALKLSGLYTQFKNEEIVMISDAIADCHSGIECRNMFGEVLHASLLITDDLKSGVI